ncbi:hypothetical protein IE81DRAFT_331650 [Ceraceosorus guamensis]|uniref:Uncharacterized protein n=1 Tax=Ceraceosorus guamensis TaxID=1522189 RepID=A0A316VS35_9BASI|nr:hypothetical protein IE81DRAFT_331650 [Ceraceosorus guamensis]PWN40416.1 hypothetical protein IE81DRAFT_331650 [Ceraceosorus guamensis]
MLVLVAGARGWCSWLVLVLVLVPVRCPSVLLFAQRHAARKSRPSSLRARRNTHAHAHAHAHSIICRLHELERKARLGLLDRSRAVPYRTVQRASYPAAAASASAQG